MEKEERCISKYTQSRSMEASKPFIKPISYTISSWSQTNQMLRIEVSSQHWNTKSLACSSQRIPEMYGKGLVGTGEGGNIGKSGPPAQLQCF